MCSRVYKGMGTSNYEGVPYTCTSPGWEVPPVRVRGQFSCFFCPRFLAVCKLCFYCIPERLTSSEEGRVERGSLLNYFWFEKKKITEGEKGREKSRKSRTNPKNFPLILELPDLVSLSSKTSKLSSYFMESETTRRKGVVGGIKLMSR